MSLKTISNRKIGLMWGLVAAIAIIVLAYREFSVLRQELEAKAVSLHRLVSQRADQHDAHMTGLSALASGNDRPLIAAMANLSDIIRQFYGRIEYVDLVSLTQTTDPIVFSTRPKALSPLEVTALQKAARASSGELQILAAEQGYLLVKRSPNTDQARYGLALYIDAAKLLENDLGFVAYTQISLSTEAGAKIYETGEALVSQPLVQTIDFSRTLGSQSQPLRLEIKQYVPVTEYVRGQMVLPVLVLMILGIWLNKAFLSQRHQTRLAEERALLGEHEARIAQASRINGLGEMASGLAHEITQPLTAILSQSQAGMRLLTNRPDEVETVKQVLSNITQQAKRGGDIINRLRSWTTHTDETVDQFDLNGVVEGLRDLMKADLKEKGITLETTLSPEHLPLVADRVAIEQVIFNLSRNALDAMSGQEGGVIHFTTKRDGETAVFMVRDHGQGIDEESLARLFEPFYTTKEKGMGLGLSLCENIITRYNGEIEIKNNPNGGVTALIRLPLKKVKDAR